MCGTRSHWPSSCTSSLRHNHECSQTRNRLRVTNGIFLRRYGSGVKVSCLHGVEFLKAKEEPLSAFKTYRAGRFPKSKGGFQFHDFGSAGVLPEWPSRIADKKAGGKGRIGVVVNVVKDAGAGGASVLHLIGPPQVRRPSTVWAKSNAAVVLDCKVDSRDDVESERTGHAFKARPGPKRMRQTKLKIKSPRVGPANPYQSYRPRGNNFQPCSPKVAEVVASLLRCKNDSGAVEIVMEKFENMSKVDISGVLSELQQRQEWKWTLEFFSWIKKQPWYFANARQYTRLIGFLGRLGKVDLACLYFQEMLLEKCKPDQYTFTAMLNAYGRAKMYDEALAVFSYMKEAQDQECRPTTVTCNSMVDALVKGGQYELAIKTFVDMREGANGLEKNCAPNVVTYNILIDALCKENLVKAAIKVLYQMSMGDPEHAIMPNVATYNTLINACGKSGLYDKAEELMEHMQGCGVEPDQITYTALIDAYGKAGQCESAENLFKGMKGTRVQVDVMAYTAMIDAYAREGLHEKAQNLFQTMCNSGIRPNQVTYLALMEAYGKAGLPEEAKNVYMSMQSQGCQANVLHYSALIDAYGKAGLHKEAAGIYKMMKRAGVRPNLVTLSALLASATRCNSWDDAMTLIACLQHTGTELERSLCTLLLGEESVVVESALKRLEHLREHRQLRQSIYNSLMDVMWRFDMKAKSAKVLAVCKQHGIYADEYTSAEWNVDLHGLSVGGAMTALMAWLSEIYLAWLWGEDTPLKVRIITGKGKHSRSKTSALKSPVEGFLGELNSPFSSMDEGSGFLAASGDEVRAWLFSPGIKEGLHLTELENLRDSEGVI
ncbi:hypothetical protein Mapa_008374 [Marchantia paleacea]|nr:hypothetical protein Mapa_008374 [Marchantia paleacea]